MEKRESKAWEEGGCGKFMSLHPTPSNDSCPSALPFYAAIWEMPESLVLSKEAVAGIYAHVYVLGDASCRRRPKAETATNNCEIHFALRLSPTLEIKLIQGFWNGR